MASLEELGRKLDEEMEKLRRFVESEVVPKTGRRAAELLRAASKRLADLAAELESRGARTSAEKK